MKIVCFKVFSKEHKALTKLDKIQRLVNWEDIQSILEKELNYQKSYLAYKPLLLFKCLLLQVWYNLSDQELEDSLARDLLFKKFTGLDIVAKIADHSTIWKYRERLSEKGLLERLLAELKEQLARRGVEMREGVGIIDASVVQASRSRRRLNKKKQDTRDKDASYYSKKDSCGKLKTTYGYKVHVKCNKEGVVKEVDFTKASIHDSRVFESLLGEEKEIYADSAYRSKKHEYILRQRGIESKIQKRNYRNKRLNEQDIKEIKRMQRRG